jgi:hypothetical protein
VNNVRNLRRKSKKKGGYGRENGKSERGKR